MKTFLKSLPYAWVYLTHPYETTDRLLGDEGASSFFIMLFIVM